MKGKNIFMVLLLTIFMSSMVSATDINVTSFTAPYTSSTWLYMTWATEGNYTNSTLVLANGTRIYEGTNKYYNLTGLVNDTSYSVNLTVRYNSTIFDNSTKSFSTSSHLTDRVWTNNAVCENIDQGFAVIGSFLAVFIIGIVGFLSVRIFKTGKIEVKELVLGALVIVIISGAVLVGSALVGVICASGLI